ncbi:MAG: ABC transporter ATP-binding protein [Nitrospirota bacterium]|nr:ABC transporter ATP-binding protein [Nitrospirota bacterium]
MNDNTVIKAHNLTKVYDGFTAVNHIDFAVRRQECFGFLGPNGAGKTTTVKMISCFLEPTDGSLEVLGMPVRTEFRRIKARLGVAHQENNLDPDLTVWDNLRVYARYFDIDAATAARRSEELLSFIGLTGKRNSAVDDLSGGMKRRLILARSLLNKPDLLILDEPTTGLDPQARHHVWDLVRRLKSEGTTVLLTTHYMDEATQLCDRLLIMDRGKILTEGSPGDLMERYEAANLEDVFLKLTGRDLAE